MLVLHVIGQLAHFVADEERFQDAPFNYKWHSRDDRHDMQKYTWRYHTYVKNEEGLLRQHIMSEHDHREHF